MSEIEKCEYVYDGISYYVPAPIAKALSELHCEVFDWRKKWQDQHVVHSREIDYWIARCKKLQSENDELNADWKVLWNENNELRDKMDSYEERCEELRQELPFDVKDKITENGKLKLRIEDLNRKLEYMEIENRDLRAELITVLGQEEDIDG